MYFELRLQLVTLQFSSALLASIAPSPGQVSTWKGKKQVNPWISAGSNADSCKREKWNTPGKQLCLVVEHQGGENLPPQAGLG